jgi:hypothetical protein
MRLADNDALACGAASAAAAPSARATTVASTCKAKDSATAGVGTSNGARSLSPQATALPAAAAANTRADKRGGQRDVFEVDMRRIIMEAFIRPATTP